MADVAVYATGRATDGLLPMKTVLVVVVDMQQEFFHSAKLVRPQVRQLVHQARQNGWPIVNVSYVGPRMSGDTQPLAYMRSLLLAADIIQVTKTDDGGGSELDACMKASNLHPQRVIFCGVNADACVRWTVAGFAALRPMVQCIISQATNAPGPEYVAGRIGLPNVKAVPLCNKRPPAAL